MMKQVILLALLFYTMCVKAQYPIKFDVKFLPNRTYEGKLNRVTYSELKFIGDSSILSKMKEKGYNFPLIITATNNMEISIKTGTINKEGSFPMEILFDKQKNSTITNGVETIDEINPIVGKKMYGSISKQGTLDLDSVAGSKMGDSFKVFFLTVVNSFFNKSQFPENSFSIGESFTRELLINVPVNGISDKLNLKIIYKIVSVQNKQAYLDLDESISLDQATNKMVNSISGGGSGKMVYSIEDSFITSSNSDISYNYKIPIGTTGTINGKISVKNIQEVLISNNN